jgi:hypothetical protein
MTLAAPRLTGWEFTGHARGINWGQILLMFYCPAGYA